MALSREVQRFLATMTQARAEALVRAYAVAGREGPDVEAAFDFLFAGRSDAECDAIMTRIGRETPDQTPGLEATDAGTGGPAADQPSPFGEFPDAEATPPPAGTAQAPEGWDTEDEPQVAPIECVLAQDPYRGRYVRMPLLWMDGEIGARLERACPGLAWLVVILLKYADRAAHIISCSKITLRKEAGIADDRTLDRRITLLCQGKPALGLPPLLRRLPGYGGKFAFRADGLAALVQLAQRTVADREARFAAIRKARSEGGTEAMQRRWEKPR